jgi:hypothetical protein
MPKSGVRGATTRRATALRIEVHSVSDGKLKASRRVVLDALLSASGSIVLLDPKSECAAVERRKSGGVMTVNPFVAVPRVQRKENDERKRKRH